MPAVIAALLTLLLVPLTYARCHVWQNSETLWTSLVRYDNDIALAHDSLGSAYAIEGKGGAATAEFDRALAIDPCFRSALHNRAVLARVAGDLRGAGSMVDRLIRCAPNDALAWRMKADLAEAAGDRAGASAARLRAEALAGRSHR